MSCCSTTLAECRWFRSGQHQRTTAITQPHNLMSGNDLPEEKSQLRLWMWCRSCSEGDCRLSSKYSWVWRFIVDTCSGCWSEQVAHVWKTKCWHSTATTTTEVLMHWAFNLYQHIMVLWQSLDLLWTDCWVWAGTQEMVYLPSWDWPTNLARCLEDRSLLMLWSSATALTEGCHPRVQVFAKSALYTPSLTCRVISIN